MLTKTEKGGEKIKKQLFLLLFCFVFCTVMCGAVSAADTLQGGDSPPASLQTSTQELPDPVINGTVKEVCNGTKSAYDPTPAYVNDTNAVPVKNATVNIKDPSTGSVLATTKTDVNGHYSVNFNSALTKFNVEIIYSSYKTFVSTLTVGESHEATLDHIFMPDILILSSGSDKSYTINSLQNRRLLFVDMFDSVYSSNPVYNWMISNVNFALTDMAMPGSGYGDWWYASLLQSPAQSNAMIAYTFGWPVIPPDALHILGYNGTNNVDSVENTIMGSYLVDSTSTANMANMVSYIQYLMGETAVDPTTLGKGPDFGIADWGIYHPDYPTSNHICSVPSVTNQQILNWILADPGYLKTSGSLKWVDTEYAAWASTQRQNVYTTFENWYTQNKAAKGAFVVIASYYPGGATVDALIRAYEKQGRAVFNFYQGGTTPSMSQFLTELTTGSGGIGPLKRGVSAVNSLYAWSMNYNNIYNGGAVSDFEKMNLAAIQAVQLTDPTSLTNPLGAQYEWTMDVVSPSMEGVFSPVALSYTDANKIVHPIDASIAKIVQLTIGWARLKELPNADKKVAIILYDYPPGKDSIGASYLDVFQSVHDILVEMKAEGYNVGTTIPTADQLYTIVAAFANKGTWAQKLLDQYVAANHANLTANGQLVDVGTYLQWFSQLPAAMQQNVTAQWGLAPGNIMVSNGKIVIPGMMFGNVFLTVQPSRGWDAVEDYHNPYLPPSHQYIAFYNWIEEVFGANAMIHLGTHGTLEFLPGRTTGLQETDWPFQLTTIPNICPYIVSNPGEGMTAKDRANALIIDHMTPAMVQSGLYGDLYNLQSLLDQYSNALKLGNTQELPALLSQITAKAASLGLPSPSANQTADSYLEVLHESLDEISESIIPLGLHIFGQSMSEDQLAQEVLTVASARKTLMNDLKDVMYPELKGVSYYDMEKNAQKYADICLAVKNQALSYINQIINGTDPSTMAAAGSALLADLIFCKELITDIRASGKAEMDSLMNALNGGYVLPGLGADPSYGDVLPTGKDFYASDTDKMPTKAAYQTGKKAADQLLAAYYTKYGKFPELVGLVMWGTELLRTDGITLGEFLYLLGVTPTWDDYGNVNGTALIPLADLKITINGKTMNRPRVDVYTTAVTGTQSWINLLNSAVKTAASAKGESFTENYLLKHLAVNPSLDRVFGLPGNVLEGTGVSDLLPNTSKWNSTSDLASVYLSRMSNAWRSTDSGIRVSQNGGGVDIERNQATFEYLLKNTNIVAQNIDSTWRLLDSDDYYDWFGGMLMTSKELGGNPEGMVTDMRNQNNMVTRDYKDEIKLELNSQILNPAYKNSLLGSASGWNEYAARYADLFAFSATNPDSVSQNTWNQVSQNLVNLASSTGLSKDYQGFAMESMSAWALEAARRGLWKPSSSMLKQLIEIYMSPTVKYGVTCCHHTCGNPQFNQWIVKQASVMPGISKAMVQQFASVMASSVGMNLNVQGSSNTGTSNGQGQSQTGKGTSSVGASPSASSSSSASQAASKSGDQASASSSNNGKASEISVKSSQGASGSSGVPFAAIAGVLALLGLLGVGYFKGRN